VSRGESLNEKMLMWHMVEDVLGWAIVFVGAIVMKFYHLPQLDAGMAIALALWILFNVFRNLRQAVDVFLMATPQGSNVGDVAAVILAIPGVEAVHHGHLWSLDGQSHIYTAHIVVKKDSSSEQISVIKNQAKKKVKELGIIEATLETEMSGMECMDPDHDIEHK
jgi:cobalt-zinc-cadmium efflux system protein